MSCQRCGKVHGCDNPICQNDDIDSIIADYKHQLTKVNEVNKTLKCSCLELINQISFIQEQIINGELVQVKPIYDFIDSRRNAEDWTTLGMIKDWIKQYAAEQAKRIESRNTKGVLWKY